MKKIIFVFTFLFLVNFFSIFAQKLDKKSKKKVKEYMSMSCECMTKSFSKIHPSLSKIMAEVTEKEGTNEEAFQKKLAQYLVDNPKEADAIEKNISEDLKDIPDNITKNCKELTKKYPDAAKKFSKEEKEAIIKAVDGMKDCNILVKAIMKKTFLETMK